jgi:hypothetical protein
MQLISLLAPTWCLFLLLVLLLITGAALLLITIIVLILVARGRTIPRGVRRRLLARGGGPLAAALAGLALLLGGAFFFSSGLALSQPGGPLLSPMELLVVGTMRAQVLPGHGSPQNAGRRVQEKHHTWNPPSELVANGHQ